MSSQNDDERLGPERTEQHTNPNNLPTQRSSPEKQDEELDFSVDTFQKRVSKTQDDSGSGGFSEVSLPEPQPEWIGRYRVEKLLGKGGFGQVFLAVDDELRRKVTVKVPHAHRISSPADVEAFLDEARMLAKLEHPNVVPVHDVGQQQDGTCFIVSRFIDGSDLYDRCKNNPLDLEKSIELVATVAEALDYVHSLGVVHRDIKPSNILLDQKGTAYLADFGLALLEEDAARTSRIAGTPAYMSPEQARGENHLVNGRSDIFSLGIVLYELIAGKKPFADSNPYTVLRMIQEHPVLPPSEWNREVSRELERICLKALSKRASGRHAKAGDLARDLRFLLANPNAILAGSEVGHFVQEGASENSAASRRATGLVPRGLRSFGTQDAHFFKDLLPGPYDRNGTPESILFWKRRIEERDPEASFRVGLIYGPSGCGKSSFCKAGLLPTLDSDVVPIFVEAAPGATETRILNRLRRSCSDLAHELGLRESLAALRHQKLLGEGKKILLIVDQFEQWLYSTQQPEHSEFAKALRQCDGEHVQCILLVRDDFWLAFSRFMEHVEIDLLQNHNMAMIDLFDIDHAKMVLREFGRAFERLPRSTADMSRDEKAFIDQAIDGLAEDGKVIPVRIALFAEMIKSRPWSTSTLKQIGGTKGVGVLFLEENFSSPNAPAEHAVHLEAVYQTLGALLPEPGANLKGHMRSREELLEVSGYREQPKQFESLIRTLDTELHLIARTTPTGRGDMSVSQSGSFSELRSGELVQGEHYQLAHDYLVPAIREWQVRMQRGTRRGRAEIRLSQRAEVWKSRPEARHLPTITEWMSMHAFTKKGRWTDTERQMMSAAGRRHGVTLVCLLLFLCVGALGIRQFMHWNSADSLAQQLQVAEPGELIGLLEDLEKHGGWSVSPLELVQAQNPPGTAKNLYSSLALLRLQAGEEEAAPELVDLIRPALLSSEPETLCVVASELKLYAQPHFKSLVEYLWEQVEDESLTRSTDEVGRSYHPRLNALIALAAFVPPDGRDLPDARWKQYADFAAEELVHFANIDRTHFSHMVKSVEPITDVLLPHLASAMTSTGDSNSLRRSAAQDLLVRLLEQRVPEFVDILLGAEVEQILAAVDLVDKNFDDVRPVLERAISVPIELTNANWTDLALQKAHAAALLLRNNVTTPEVWSVLVPDTDTGTESEDEIPEARLKAELQRLLATKHWEKLVEEGDLSVMRARYGEVSFGRTRIPNSRTRLVQRMKLFGATPEPLLRKLLVEQDEELQRGLLQALGAFDAASVDPSLKEKVVTLARGWLLSAKSAALRSNAFWFLLRWDQREWATEQFQLTSRLREEGSDWSVNSIGHTMIRLPQHRADDCYRVEAAATEVTVGQLEAWQPDGVEEFNWSGEKDRTAGNVTYHEAVAFCNWLSREEGLGDDQLCYPDRTDPTGPPALIYDDYQTRKGYRLPMAEEWFFTCSAGTITDYSFGSGAEGPGPVSRRLFEGYIPPFPEVQDAWLIGSARPNDFGIFDMYSKVREWTNDVDPGNPKRIQLCGFDYRGSLGVRGVAPRYLGYSEPNTLRSFYGFRLFRSVPMKGEVKE